MSAVAMNLPHCQLVFELAWLIPSTSTPNTVSDTVQSLVAQTIPFTLTEFEVIIQCGVTQKSSTRDSRQVCGGAAVFAFADVEDIVVAGHRSRVLLRGPESFQTAAFEEKQQRLRSSCLIVVRAADLHIRRRRVSPTSRDISKKMQTCLEANLLQRSLSDLRRSAILRNVSTTEKDSFDRARG